MLCQRRSLLRPRRPAEGEAARRPSCQRRWPAALALAALAALVLSRGPSSPAVADGASASGQVSAAAASTAASSAAAGTGGGVARDASRTAAKALGAASGAAAVGRGLPRRRRAHRRRRGGTRRRHGATAAVAGAATARSAGTAAGGGGSASASASARPDLLLILTDSFDGRLLDPSSTLSRAVALPHLRRLAARGTNFVRAYTLTLTLTLTQS